MRRAGALFLMGLLVVPLVPVADAASHNARWKADGVAVTVSGQMYLLSIEWHGACQRYFTVDLFDPVTQALVNHRDFPGFQLINNLGTLISFVETFSIQAQGTGVGVQYSTSGVQFVQHAFPNTMNYVFQGTYQGMTIAAATLADSWTFC